MAFELQRSRVSVKRNKSGEIKSLAVRRFLSRRLLNRRFLDRRFLGRRFLGRRFLGRRFLGRRFLGRRFLGRRFLGRRFLGHRFLGRRSSSFSRSSFSRRPKMFQICHAARQNITRFQALTALSEQKVSRFDWFTRVRAKNGTVPVKKLTCFFQVPNLHT